MYFDNKCLGSSRGIFFFEKSNLIQKLKADQSKMTMTVLQYPDKESHCFSMRKYKMLENTKKTQDNYYTVIIF